MGLEVFFVFAGCTLLGKPLLQQAGNSGRPNLKRPAYGSSLGALRVFALASGQGGIVEKMKVEVLNHVQCGRSKARLSQPSNCIAVNTWHVARRGFETEPARQGLESRKPASG